MDDQLQQRVPPSSIPAEACVLGSMILSAEALQEGCTSIRPEWFYRPSHQTIFAELRKLAAADTAIDLVLLRDSFGDRLGSIGGIEYLASLVEGVPNASSISHYADIIRDKHTKRKLIQSGTAICDMGYSSMSAVEAVGEAYSLVQSAGEQQKQRRQVSAGDAMASMLEHAEAVQLGHIRPSLPSGFPALDARLTGGGFRPGNLTIAAARPGIGKSLMAGDFTRNMACAGHGGLFVSGEMTATEIMERHAAAMTNIYAAKIARGNLTDAEKADLTTAAGAIKNWRMEIMDTSATISEIAAEAKRLNSKWNGGLDCVIIDYLGLMRPDSTTIGREQQVGLMARQCKMYAQSMNIPWIVLHQLNRDGAHGRPEMYQLRDSGQLEEHANTVLLLDWDTETEHGGAVEDGGPWRHLLIRVAKQRGGLTTSWGGAIHRRLRGYVTRTEEYDFMEIPE